MRPSLAQGKALGTDVATPPPASQSPERTPLDASAPDAREGNEASRIAPSGLWVVRGVIPAQPQGFTLGSGGACRWHFGIEVKTLIGR
jgi:hypothetical protein